MADRASRLAIAGHGGRRLWQRIDGSEVPAMRLSGWLIGRLGGTARRWLTTPER
jgi:hypothetical protein